MKQQSSAEVLSAFCTRRSGNMQEIRYADWSRREVYEFFSRISNPFYMVTFRQDVTPLLNYTRAHHISFYQAMVWACTEALNQVSAFRTAMRSGVPVLLNRRDPSFTDLKPGAEQFHIVTLEHLPDLEAFCREATRISQAQTAFIDASKETDSLIYYSCLPWIDLTALTNERDLSSPDALDDSIPRLAWGRYTEENGRTTLGLSMEVNHRFIDGVHIGQFSRRLEETMQQLIP